MNINSVSSVGFGASICRTPKDFNPSNRELTRQECLDSFDRQIRKIEAAKQQYVELDEFIHTPEVKELVDDLPEEGEVNIGGAFVHRNDDESEVSPCSLTLTYEQEGVPTCEEIDLLDLEEGPIDKNAIVNWLKGLKEYTSQFMN